MQDKPTAAYVFYSGGYAKIGHTSDLDMRLYQILWGERPAYVEAPVGHGEIVASREFPTKAEAVSVERSCQDVLNPYVCGPTRRGAGGRREWFLVPRQIAIDALHEVAEHLFLSVALSKREKAVLARHVRRHGLPSIESAMLNVIEMEMARQQSS